VDLPGYGYAHTARTQREEFNTAVRDYLAHRPTLRQTFVLIDSRHPPAEIDLKFVHWLGKNALPFALIFTKIDKQAVQHTRNAIARFQQAMAASTDAVPPVFASSAETKTGRAEILAFIAKSLPAAAAATSTFRIAPMMNQPRRPAAASVEPTEEAEDAD
jgi:GTP-binding protein